MVARKGLKNKATLARGKAFADLVMDAKDPLTFFTGIMRDALLAATRRTFTQTACGPFAWV